MPRLTKTAWFGPKRYVGWGWSPRTWQGVVVTVLLVALIIADGLLVKGTGRWIGGAVVVTAFLVVALLTGDPPGGPSLRPGPPGRP